MIIIDPSSPKQSDRPFWLDLALATRDPLKLLVLPCTVDLLFDAQADAAGETFGEHRASFLRALAERAIQGWEGVGQPRRDPDTGLPVVDDAGTPLSDPLPVSPAAIAALLSLPPVAQAFFRQYYLPAQALEKNG